MAWSPPMPELLLELRSEESPARMQARAAADLAELVLKGLADAGIPPERHVAFATPRRVVLQAAGLASRQPDQQIERRGPRSDAPQRARDGFLQSLPTAEHVLEER